SHYATHPKHHGDQKQPWGIHGRGASRDAGARPRAESGRASRPARGQSGRGSDVLAKIAEMQEPDRAMAERLHAIIKANAPPLCPRTWSGSPAYAKESNVFC